MNSYKDLIVWQKSFLLAREIYKVTGNFPKTEQYGLTSQLRRAGVSVMSNIAEGFSRKSPKENYQFISIAFGSTSEIEAQLLLARELKFTEDIDLVSAENILQEVRKILTSMIYRIKNSSKS